MIGLGLVLGLFRFAGGLRLRLRSDCDFLLFGEGDIEGEARLRRLGESDNDLSGCLPPFLTGEDGLCLLENRAVPLSRVRELLDCAKVASLFGLGPLLLGTAALSSASGEPLLLAGLDSSFLGGSCCEDDKGEGTADEPK